ncbi:tryptophan-rich sensory protein [Sphingomonas sp. LB-2]|uniref:TspO/MBR family protein n=1 Tax=Sphingomonas caeni TaxID=2984949 RepID=UPI002231C1B5|nr:TspO/MBR family protein [Sphingomonas caeni]MCW3847339.1 tryptophan-rich sensory protein [Sphingomonas caeni]
MREIASKGQLRLAYLRWAVVTVPFILLLGFTSARLVPSGAQNRWYKSLLLPDNMPPEWAFPVAWTVIYVLLGLALAMIINARGSTLRGPALVLFAVQMAVNLAWTPVFFGMHQVMTALILLGTLGVLVFATILLFGRIRTGAALLLLPYLAWVGYAGFLLYQINQLNPNAGSLVSAGGSEQIQVDNETMSVDGNDSGTGNDAE